MLQLKRIKFLKKIASPRVPFKPSAPPSIKVTTPLSENFGITNVSRSNYPNRI